MPDVLGDKPSTKYFSAATLVFVASFLVLPSSKMVNNVFYVFLAIPAVVFLPGYVAAKRLSWLGALWLIFFGYFAVRGVSDGDLSFLKHLLYVALFVFVLGCLVSHSFFQWSFLVRSLFWATIAYVMLNALWLWIAGAVPVGERVLWLSGRMAGPIYTSMWISICFGLCITTWVRNNRRWEMTLAMLCALFVCGYVLQSRSGLVGLFITLFALGFIASDSVRRYPKIAFLGFAALLVGVAVLASWVPALSTLWARGDSYRLELWEHYLDVLGRCGYWQGCGIDYSPMIQLADGMTINHPHNVYLSLAMYGGLPGAILFVTLMAAVLFNAARARNMWGYALLLGLIMVNFDGHKVLDSPNELWLLLLLPAGLASATRALGYPSQLKPAS
nr:O-antigen ligase family protein [Halopseudomonas xinjiangensis]